MNTRIYAVVNTETKMHRLVEASSSAQAIRHCVLGLYKADVASAKAVADFMRTGLMVEKANEIASVKSKIEQQQTTTQQQQ
jgi:hypothetical protein